MTKEQDTEFQDDILKKVHLSDAGGYEITMERGTIFFVPSCPIVPCAGMSVRFYGRGFGWPVRGVDIDGHECFYRTPFEQERKQRDELAESERMKRQRFETNRKRYDARFDALPEVFRARIARFRSNCPTFRWDYEPYELFCCEQAVVIANALKTPDAIAAFKDLPWAEQVAAVPGLDTGHSVNTFDCACGLAKLYLTTPVAVFDAMGAMAPVVGSVAYGDLPASLPRGEKASEPDPR